jgi:hypothetical protein
MDELDGIEDRCNSCNALVPEDSGYENGRGEVLCTECFVDQWGPSSEELVRDYERGAAVGAGTPGSSSMWTSGEFSGLDLS